MRLFLIPVLISILLVSAFSDQGSNATSPGDVKILVNKANMLWEEEKYEDALVQVEQAIEINGLTEGLLEYRCDLLFKLKRGTDLLDNTLLLEEMSTEKTPWNFLKIADAYVFLGNSDEALFWIEKAVRERGFTKFEVFDAERYDLVRQNERFIQVMNEIMEEVAIGNPAKDFHLPLLSGDEISLASLRGQVVLVDFWATWCPPCLKEMPNLRAIYEDLHDQGFEIISICMDEDENIERAHLFMSKNSFPWKQVFTKNGYENEAAKLYKVNGLPSTWLIDRNGTLRQVGIKGETLRQEVERLVKGV